MSIATWEFESPPLHLFAEIAQLVEHNLAKVGVASSSLVFRSIDDGYPFLRLLVFFSFLHVCPNAFIPSIRLYGPDVENKAIKRTPVLTLIFQKDFIRIHSQLLNSFPRNNFHHADSLTERNGQNP